VLLDLPLAQAAIRYAAAELDEIQTLVNELTDGVITSVRSPRMREWVLERVGEQAKKLMWNGEKYSIDKTVRANLLLMENPDEIPPHVADVIQCADDLWASSVAKFNRLSSLADEDDCRVRGAFVFAGGQPQDEPVATAPKSTTSPASAPTIQTRYGRLWYGVTQSSLNTEKESPTS
jgi:hypothetical protein